MKQKNNINKGGRPKKMKFNLFVCKVVEEQDGLQSRKQIAEMLGMKLPRLYKVVQRHWAEYQKSKK